MRSCSNSRNTWIGRNDPYVSSAAGARSTRKLAQHLSRRTGQADAGRKATESMAAGAGRWAAILPTPRTPAALRCRYRPRGIRTGGKELEGPEAGRQRDRGVGGGPVGLHSAHPRTRPSRPLGLRHSRYARPSTRAAFSPASGYLRISLEKIRNSPAPEIRRSGKSPAPEIRIYSEPALGDRHVGWEGRGGVVSW